jgi:ABC-type nitrate/sulfonate/bicarbonate transport system permease component
VIERGAALPPRPNLVRRVILDYLPPVLVLVGLVVAWEAWVFWRDTPAYRLPAPSAIWDAFWRTRETLPAHTRTTVNEALLGLAFGAAAAVVLAAAMASVGFLRRVLYPPMVVSQTIPMIVLAPLLTIWFGIGMTPKVVVVALVTFFPVLVGTTDALLRADRQMLALVRSMGANRLEMLRYVMFPSAIPGFFAGLKIAAAYAVTGAVIAELMGARSGLGLYINRSDSAFRTDQVFVGIVLVALLSLALFAATHLANRLVAPWLFIKEGNE